MFLILGGYSLVFLGFWLLVVILCRLVRLTCGAFHLFVFLLTQSLADFLACFFYGLVFFVY